MTRRRRSITARAVLASWALLGLAATPATAGADPHAHEATVHSAAVPAASAVAAIPAAECAAEISCGTGCTATLAVGVCTVAIEYEVQLALGGLKIGPSFKIECGYCDCWYLAPGPNGTLLKRHYDLSCGASFPGLEHE